MPNKIMLLFAKLSMEPSRAAKVWRPARTWTSSTISPTITSTSRTASQFRSSPAHQKLMSREPLRQRLLNSKNVLSFNPEEKWRSCQKFPVKINKMTGWETKKILNRHKTLNYRSLQANAQADLRIQTSVSLLTKWLLEHLSLKQRKAAVEVVRISKASLGYLDDFLSHMVTQIRWSMAQALLTTPCSSCLKTTSTLCISSNSKL